MSSEDFFEKEKLNIGKMESELFLFVVNDLAQSESELISDSNTQSVHHRFEDCTYKSGYALYGYSIEEGVIQ